MKTINLTQNKIALVDDEDYENLLLYKWHAVKDKNTFYCGRTTSRKLGKQRRVQMHAEIMGSKKGFVIDHIDGDGLNNQRNNLRFVTQQQNCWNRKPDKRPIPYKGVSYCHPMKKYEVTICAEGRKFHLGYFGSAVCAALAYDAKAREVHGKYAKCNFGDPNES